MSFAQAVLSFALVAGLLTLVPGIDTSLVLRGALTRGRSSAFATAAGVCTGALVWGVAAAAGASALLAASDIAYRALTIAGAAYLAWLGASLIWKSITSGPPHAAGIGGARLPGGRPLWRAWLTGAATNLLNPKVGVFYIATIPQFIPDGAIPIVMGLLLAGIHAALSLVWFTVIIVGTGFASTWLRNQQAVRVIDRITGIALIGFGARLALDPH